MGSSELYGINTGAWKRALLVFKVIFDNRSHADYLRYLSIALRNMLSSRLLTRCGPRASLHAAILRAQFGTGSVRLDAQTLVSAEDSAKGEGKESGKKSQSFVSSLLHGS